eukprot:TRINITY_DN7696_c0_g1_i1.p1 TRINITY_DN7696_c0_g1~~TRINITY_DN7696_c0_g1_i1.p1  ORF type:complete len:169 (-),score=43.73 TRINITY_DN7696_c0_g1_i1:83-589(-)
MSPRDEGQLSERGFQGLEGPALSPEEWTDKRASEWKLRGGKRGTLWKLRGGKRGPEWKLRGGKRVPEWKLRGGKRFLRTALEDRRFVEGGDDDDDEWRQESRVGKRNVLGGKRVPGNWMLRGGKRAPVSWMLRGGKRSNGWKFDAEDLSGVQSRFLKSQADPTFYYLQ